MQGVLEKSYFFSQEAAIRSGIFLAAGTVVVLSGKGLCFFIENSILLVQNRSTITWSTAKKAASQKFYQIIEESISLGETGLKEGSRAVAFGIIKGGVLGRDYCCSL